MIPTMISLYGFKAKKEIYSTKILRSKLRVELGYSLLNNNLITSSDGDIIHLHLNEHEI